jgi:hypothetical protein
MVLIKRFLYLKMDKKSDHLINIPDISSLEIAQESNQPPSQGYIQQSKNTEETKEERY